MSPLSQVDKNMHSSVVINYNQYEMVLLASLRFDLSVCACIRIETGDIAIASNLSRINKKRRNNYLPPTVPTFTNKLIKMLYLPMACANFINIM